MARASDSFRTFPRVSWLAFAVLALAGSAACSTDDEPASPGEGGNDAGGSGGEAAGGSAGAGNDAAGGDGGDPPVIHEGFEVGDPIEEGLDADKLDALMAKAESEASDAVIIVHNGKLVVEEHFGGDPDLPILAMSASKSFVSLAAGLMIDEGLLALDDEASAYVPEMMDGTSKEDITVRQLLNHTSGLEASRFFESSPTIVGHVETCEMTFEPGTSAQYNNNAVDLLAAVLGAAAGESMADYLERELFDPLGADNAVWKTDAAQVPLGAGELAIRPIDGAKVGQMMLDGGRWHDEQIISSAWVDQSHEVSQPHDKTWGLLWWIDADVTQYTYTAEILSFWEGLPIDPEVAAILNAELVGQTYDSYDAFFLQLQSTFTAQQYNSLLVTLFSSGHTPFLRATETEPQVGYHAAGWLGQFITVCTDTGTVGVRMRRATPEDYENQTEENGFQDFPQRVCDLAK